MYDRIGPVVEIRGDPVNNDNFKPNVTDNAASKRSGLLGERGDLQS